MLNSPPTPSFALVILNYKTPDLVINCIRSVVDQLIPGFDHIVVVDNASGDGSVELISQEVASLDSPELVEIVTAPQNGGFSAGNNLGIQQVDADAYWLTNSDTLFLPGAVEKMRCAVQSHGEAGILSPRLVWPDRTPQISCFRFHSPLSELIDAAATGPLTKLLERSDVPLPVQDDPFCPDWTSFASVVVRQEVIMQVGPLDDRFFMYFEDVDYCRRVWQQGWMVCHQPEVEVIHLRGGTSEVKALTAERARRPHYYYASRNRYFAKHYSTPGLWLANLMWLVRPLVGQPDVAGRPGYRPVPRSGRP